MTELEAGLKLVVKLELLGHPTFLVGGCVRDMVMGLEPHDIDLATACPVEELQEHFSCHDIGQSKDFGITTVAFEGFNFEVAQFRTDGESSDGRHPDDVLFVDNIEEDLARRDLTINAMAMDFERNIIDPFGGMKDIATRVVRCVGNPEERFEEDFLRILRTVRFAGRFGFDIEEKTKLSLLKHKERVLEMKVERIKDELFKMADSTGEVFARTVELLDEVGLLELVLPEVALLKTVKETPRFHPEAWENGDGSSFVHTLCAVRQNVVVDPLHNLAVLFHDLGKPLCHSWNEEKQRFSMHGHEGVGAEVIEDLAKRLKFSNKDKELFQFCAANHMKVFHVREMKKSKVLPLVMDERWEFLKNVMFCDDSCRKPLFDVEDFSKRVAHVEKLKEDFKEVPQNVVTGHQVMELTGLKPSPEVGRVVREVSEKFLDAKEFVCLRRLVLDAVK